MSRIAAFQASGTAARRADVSAVGEREPDATDDREAGALQQPEVGDAFVAQGIELVDRDDVRRSRPPPAPALRNVGRRVSTDRDVTAAAVCACPAASSAYVLVEDAKMSYPCHSVRVWLGSAVPRPSRAC
jgi:hypothetical protein